MRKILLLAGEESGMIYARGIAAALGDRVEVRGYGDYGFEVADLAVMGFFAVMKRIFYFLRVKRTMERAIDEWHPDVVCTVDYPGMNLKLAAYAKRRGIRAVHVVCPQVWAWHQGRIPKIEASLDRLCCFFPFEPSLFREGLATFVGHPLAECFGEVRTAASKGKLLAILPGSRIGEIERFLPRMLMAANAVVKRHGGWRIAIPAANDRAFAAIIAVLERSEVAHGIEVLHGGARELLKQAGAAVVASGTATLEAALARCPTVLVYELSPLMGWIAKRLIKGVRHVGLANVIWEKCAGGEVKDGDFPMVELLQENFTVERMTTEIERIIEPAGREAAIARLDAAMKLLDSGSGGAFAKIAVEVLK